MVCYTGHLATETYYICITVTHILVSNVTKTLKVLFIALLQTNLAVVMAVGCLGGPAEDVMDGTPNSPEKKTCVRKGS